jgi:hypothetical protein
VDRETSAGVPFFIEPFIGWRAWRLIRTRAGGLRLTSVGDRVIWAPRKPIQAECRVGVYHAEGPPDADCTCGIYAASLHAEELVTTQYAIRAHVVGTVSMWGRIVEHEHGARSEFAYPSQLAVICELCSIENHSLVAAERMLEIPDGFMARCSAHDPDLNPARRVVSELLSTYGVEQLPLNSVPLVRAYPGALAPGFLRPTAARPSPRPDPPAGSPEREPAPSSLLAQALPTIQMLPVMLATVLGGMLLLSVVTGLITDVVHAVTPHHAASPAAATASPSSGAVAPFGRAEPHGGASGHGTAPNRRFASPPDQDLPR